MGAAIERHRSQALERCLIVMGFELWKASMNCRALKLGKKLGCVLLSNAWRALKTGLRLRWTRWRVWNKSMHKWRSQNCAGRSLHLVKTRLALAFSFSRWRLLVDNLSWQRNSRQMIESTLTQVGLERQRMRTELEREMEGRRLKLDSKTVRDAAQSATLEERCRQIARRRLYCAFFWWRPGFESFRKPKLHLQRQLQAAMVTRALVSLWLALLICIYAGSCSAVKCTWDPCKPLSDASLRLPSLLRLAHSQARAACPKFTGNITLSDWSDRILASLEGSTDSTHTGCVPIYAALDESVSPCCCNPPQ